MGWCGGTEFAERYIKVCKEYVKDEKVRTKLYTEYIDFLTNEDWDTMEESLGIDPVWDKAMKKYYLDNDWEWEFIE